MLTENLLCYNVFLNATVINPATFTGLSPSASPWVLNLCVSPQLLKRKVVSVSYHAISPSSTLPHYLTYTSTLWCCLQPHREILFFSEHSTSSAHSHICLTRMVSFSQGYQVGTFLPSGQSCHHRLFLIVPFLLLFCEASLSPLRVTQIHFAPLFCEKPFFFYPRFLFPNRPGWK